MLEEIVDITTPDGVMGVIVKHPDGAGPFPVVNFASWVIGPRSKS